MVDETRDDGLQAQSIFLFTLKDDSGQPNLVIDSPESRTLIWTLRNPASGPDDKLVVTPFKSGQVGPNQYHFRFGFDPGALTVEPALRGWDVAVAKYPDGPTIQFVYIAYPGQADLVIGPNSAHDWTLTYAKAVQSNAHDAKVHVTLTAGSQVMLNGKPITGRSYLADLSLIRSNVPALSAPPISVDFVGRRSVLNDGMTPNSLTFALTNMMQGSISLSPGGATKFTVWFDAAPDWYQAAPKFDPQPDFARWAAADVQSIGGIELHLPSDWSQSKNLLAAPRTESSGGAGHTVSTQWTLTVAKAFNLQPQQPVLFTFTGLKSGLAPGIARMYLRYESLPGFRDGALIAEMEKTPLIPGPDQGQGLYLSLGTPTQDAPPAPKFDGGLYIDQLGEGPAATFANRSGKHAWQIIPAGPKNPAGAGKLLLQVDGAATPVASFQSDGSGPKLGIGTAKPEETLHVNGCLRSDGRRTYLTGFDADSYHWIRTSGDKEAGSDEKKSVFIALGTDDKGTAETVHLKPGAEHGLTVWRDGRVGIDLDRDTPTAKLEILVPDTDKSTDLLRVRKGATDHLVVRNDGAVHIEKLEAGNPLVVKGRIQSSAADGGLWLSDKGDGFVGNNGNNIGFFTSAEKVGWDALQIEKSTGNVGIGTQFPRGRLHVKGRPATPDASSISLVVENDSGQTGSSPRLVLVDTAGSDVASAPAWIIDNYADVFRIYRQKNLTTSGGTGKAMEIHKEAIYIDSPLYIRGEGKNWKLWYDKPGGYQWATLTPDPSDLRLKEGVRPITDALDRIKRLQGAVYRWSEAGLDYLTRHRVDAVTAGPDASEEEHEAARREERRKAVEELSGDQMGLIAQEVEAVVPEVVVEDEDGHKAIRYPQLVALLIEAVKEQGRIVDELSRRVAGLTRA